MAEEKKGEKSKKGVDAGPFTTLRVYEEDGGDLSDLSALERATIADVYEKHVRPVIRKILRERLQERLKRAGQ